MFIPFIIMVITALKSPADFTSAKFIIIPEKLLFTNFIDSMSVGIWPRWFANSLLISILATVISLLFNSMAGYAFARLKFKGNKELFFILLLGLMIPVQIIIIPEFIMLTRIPLMGGNNIFGKGGSGLIDTYAGILLPQLAGVYGVFLCRQFFLGFPKALDEAATLDGASTWRIFFQIYLPLSKPLMATLGTLKFTASYNDYLWPLLVVSSEKMRTVQISLAMFRYEVVEWQLLMAATIIVMIPTLIVFIAAQKYFVSGMVSSGFKG
jgi:multiple sugar transport system permease protein